MQKKKKKKSLLSKELEISWNSVFHVMLRDQELRLIASRFVSVDPKSLYDLFGMSFGHVPQLVLDRDWTPQG